VGVIDALGAAIDQTQAAERDWRIRAARLDAEHTAQVLRVDGELVRAGALDVDTAQDQQGSAKDRIGQRGDGGVAQTRRPHHGVAAARGEQGATQRTTNGIAVDVVAEMGDGDRRGARRGGCAQAGEDAGEREGREIASARMS
jgi:hypothetical protein